MHGLDMAHVAGEGTVAEEGVVVLIRMWNWESWNISTWVAQIPVLFVELLSNFMKGLHCHTPNIISKISNLFLRNFYKVQMIRKQKETPTYPRQLEESWHLLPMWLVPCKWAIWRWHHSYKFLPFFFPTHFSFIQLCMNYELCQDFIISSSMGVSWKIKLFLTCQV